jgi:hypothetical protein
MLCLCGRCIHIMVRKTITGRGFRLEYDSAQIIAYVEVIQDDLALLILRFLDDSDVLLSVSNT